MKRQASKIRTLLFDRAAGWTPTIVRQWAKEHGFKHSNADMEITDRFVHVRQDNSNTKSKKLRTITLSDELGIKAVIQGT